MEGIREFLLSMGLTKNESEVYCVLVEEGTSSVTDISKKTHIHRPNIYDTIRRLIDKGLVYQIDLSPKVFTARPPRSLLHYLKEKESALRGLVKDFERKAMPQTTPEQVRLSKGIFALRETINNFLLMKQPIATYGIPKITPQAIGAFLHHFHKERIRQKIPIRHIYNSDAGERVRFLNKMKYTEARLLPPRFDSHVTTTISGNKVVLWIWDDSVTVLEIDDPKIAEPYRNYFEVLWNKAKIV